MIEFSAGATRRAWKARLNGEHAVFVAVATSELLVGTRGTVALTPRSNESGGGALQADLTIGGTRLKITIAPDSLRLYEQWKAGAQAGRPAAA